MRRWSLLAVCAAFLGLVAIPSVPPGPIAAAAEQAAAPEKKKLRGLIPTPKHKLFAIPQFKKPLKAPPPSVLFIPNKLSMWLNDSYGDCVTAEEAFNQAATGTFIQDQTVYTWAKANRYLNGAMLTDVMDSMRQSGFQQGGTTYGIGSYSAINFNDEPTLQSALSIAPVKIGIDANALPSGAGSQMGWSAFGGSPGQFSNEDHCVSLAGYGPATTICSALNVPVPSSASATKTYYALFTWNTIGMVDHEWIMSTCQEAYLRNPTATQNGTPVPNPGPGPNPAPVPPTPGPTPVPPTPTPTPTPTPGGFTGTVTYTYSGGILVDVLTSTGKGPQSLRAELEGAGVNPLIILDTLQLITDLKNKAGIAVIITDTLKIIADLQTPAPTPTPTPVPPSVKGSVVKADCVLAG